MRRSPLSWGHTPQHVSLAIRLDQFVRRVFEPQQISRALAPPSVDASIFSGHTRRRLARERGEEIKRYQVSKNLDKNKMEKQKMKKLRCEGE